MSAPAAGGSAAPAKETNPSYTKKDSFYIELSFYLKITQFIMSVNISVVLDIVRFDHPPPPHYRPRGEKQTKKQFKRQIVLRLHVLHYKGMK